MASVSIFIHKRDGRSARPLAVRILLASFVVVVAFATAAPGATLDADVTMDAPALAEADLASPHQASPLEWPDVAAHPLDETPSLPPLPALSSPGIDGDVEVAPLALGDAPGTREDPLVPDAWADALAAVPPAAPAAVAAAGGLALLHAFGLFTRITRSELLDNEHRDAVFQLVKAEPGVALGEIAQRLGLGWGTAVYHLDRLQRAGFVASERSGLRRCFFPVGTLPRESRRGIGALRAGSARSVAAFLMERPGATQGELAQALGISASVASKQVTKLEEAGLVRREREWKTVRLHPAPGLAALLQPIAEPSPQRGAMRPNDPIVRMPGTRCSGST